MGDPDPKSGRGEGGVKPEATLPGLQYGAHCPFPIYAYVRLALSAARAQAVPLF
jgi:hypothetical protein